MSKTNEQAIAPISTIKNVLLQAVSAVTGILPIAHQHQAERFVKRAILTISTAKPDMRAKIEACTPASIVTAVLTAAESGFAIDNRFAYLIPYGNEATCQFDWKALVALAKRSGAIVDARPEIVCENDSFDFYDEDGRQRYRFRQFLDGPRGRVKGAFCVVVIPGAGNHYRVTYMNKLELDKVRAASKAPNSPAWTVWEERMQCKAVVRRGLHGFMDDPGLSRILDHEDQFFDFNEKKAIPHEVKHITQAVNSVVGGLNLATGDKIEGPKKEQPEREPEKQETKSADKETTQKPKTTAKNDIVKQFGLKLGTMMDMDSLDSGYEQAIGQTDTDKQRAMLHELYIQRAGELEKGT